MPIEVCISGGMGLLPDAKMEHSVQLTTARRQLSLMVLRVAATCWLALVVSFMYVDRAIPAEPSSMARSLTAAEREVVKMVQEKLAGIFRRCGDSFYSEDALSSPLSIYQVKGLVVGSIVGERLDELARLNGFQWRGTVEISSKMSRHYLRDQWEDWAEGFSSLTSAYDSWTAFIAEKKGDWVVEIQEVSFPLRPVDCSRIPQG
jgi:hypothetical protein